MTIQEIVKPTQVKPDWKSIVSEWQRKGDSETTTSFCKARGINEHQFYYWKSRYLAKPAIKPQWSPVKIESPGISPSYIKIHVANKLTIELSSQVDVEVLSRLILALGVG